MLYFPGGKGANQAVAAAKLGAPTTLIGRLGKDAFGQELRTFLAAQGVDLGLVQDTSGAHTGTAVITVANADNTIVVVPGANALVSAADVGGAPLAKGDVAVSQFEIPLPAITAFFKRARAAGATTILNPAPAHRIRRASCSISSISSSSTKPNSALLAETELRDTDDHARFIEAARSLQRGRDKIICVTLGKRGVLALIDGAAADHSGPRGQGGGHHRRRRLFCRRAGRAARRRQTDSRCAGLRQRRRIDLRAADGRGAVDADGGGGREARQSLAVRLSQRALQIEAGIGRLLRRDRAVGKDAAPEHMIAGAIDEFDADSRPAL